MRVAYVCTDPGVPIFGRKGGSIHVREVVRALRARGADVEIIARRLGGQAPADLASVPVHRVSSLKGTRGLERERLLIDSNSEVREALRERVYDFVYERQTLFATAGMEHAKESGVPGLLEVNAPLIDEQQQYRELALIREAREAARVAFESASAILAVSDPLAGRLAETPGVTRDRLHVVPNGVDTDRLSPDVYPAMPLESREIRIGFVGSLRDWHDVASLVDAFALVRAHNPQLRLVIVGDGPQRASIEEQCSGLKLGDSTMLIGAVDASDIPSWLSSMDIAVAPYPALDGFYFSPLKLFEYMASGRAIVASNIGQIADVIDDAKTGLLYNAGDTASLAHALSRLIESAELRRSLGEQARAVALREHRWTSVAARILTLADELRGPLVTREGAA